MWHTNKKEAIENWRIANANYTLEQYEKANRFYEAAYDELKNEGLFLQYVGKSLSLSRNLGSSQIVLKRALVFVSNPAVLNALGSDLTEYGTIDPENYDSAERYLNKSMHMLPARYHARYMLMELYNKKGMQKKQK